MVIYVLPLGPIIDVKYSEFLIAWRDYDILFYLDRNPNRGKMLQYLLRGTV